MSSEPGPSAPSTTTTTLRPKEVRPKGSRQISWEALSDVTPGGEGGCSSKGKERAASSFAPTPLAAAVVAVAPDAGAPAAPPRSILEPTGNSHLPSRSRPYASLSSHLSDSTPHSPRPAVPPSLLPDRKGFGCLGQPVKAHGEQSRWSWLGEQSFGQRWWRWRADV